jgi:hypothetical protein
MRRSRTTNCGGGSSICSGPRLSGRAKRKFDLLPKLIATHKEALAEMIKAAEGLAR